MLVIGGGHDYNGFAKMLADSFEKVGGITLVETLGPGKEKGQGHIDKLADLKRDQADLVIFYTVGYKLGEPQERALEKFVEDGGGVAAVHCASASFGNSQVWFRLIERLRFAGHHKGLHKLEIKVEGDGHPVTAGVGSFTVEDEEYNHSFAKVERKVIAEFKQRPEGSKAARTTMRCGSARSARAASSTALWVTARKRGRTRRGSVWCCKAFAGRPANRGKSSFPRPRSNAKIAPAAP